MSPGDALALRMSSLLLSAAPLDTVADVVSWFGALQAQDLGSVMWSLGVRLPGRTHADLHDALERREALRTWPMRGTVHLVPARDARWMLELMGVRTLNGAAARRQHLGLSDETAKRAVDVLGTVLAGGKRLTRAQCLAALEEAGIAVSGQLGYHLLWYASQLGVTCIAPNIGTEQTFALLDEWAPGQHRPEAEEALATIAHRYFRSHGPASRKDLVRWTGLTATEAKRGIAAAGDTLAPVRVDGAELIAERTALEAGPPPGIPRWLTLPGFDEYMLGYADRALMVDAAHLPAIVPGGNGVFQSTIVHAGRVAGTWKRTTGAKQTTVEIRPLVPLPARERARVEKAFAAYGSYTGKALRFRWPDEAMTKANSA